MELTIVNFNIQNKVKIKNYDGGEYPKLLANFISKQKPDIICLQELTNAYENKYKNFYSKLPLYW